jgi:hypothetical protein
MMPYADFNLLKFPGILAGRPSDAFMKRGAASSRDA